MFLPDYHPWETSNMGIIPQVPYQGFLIHDNTLKPLLIQIIPWYGTSMILHKIFYNKRTCIEKVSFWRDYSNSSTIRQINYIRDRDSDSLTLPSTGGFWPILLWGDVKLFFSLIFFYFIGASATKRFLGSRVFRYGLSQDILSKRQRSKGGRGVQRPPPVLWRVNWNIMHTTVWVRILLHIQTANAINSDIHSNRLS